jgi:hypothetical protein
MAIGPPDPDRAAHRGVLAGTERPYEAEARERAMAAIPNPSTSDIEDWVASQAPEQQEDYQRAIQAIAQGPLARF